MKMVFQRVENKMGKFQKCWLPPFSPFPTMFQKALSLKVRRVWSTVNLKFMNKFIVKNVQRKLFDIAKRNQTMKHSI